MTTMSNTYPMLSSTAMCDANTYELSFKVRFGYLFAWVEAANSTPDTIVGILRKIADKCAELDSKLLLIDRDIPAMMSTPQCFDALGEFLRSIPDVRVAVVNRHAATDVLLRDVIAAGPQSGANAAYFDNIPAAEKWLLNTLKFVKT